MQCWACGSAADGGCRFCGRGVCKAHARTRAFLFEAWSDHDELRGLGEQIGELFKRYLDRLVDPAKRPPGSRPVRLVQWGIPARPPTEEAGE